MSPERRRAQNMRRLENHLHTARAACTRTARRLLSSEESAEDAVQEAGLRALKTVHQFDPRLATDGNGFEAWFHTILINVCTDMQRAEKRRPRPLPFSALPEGFVEETIPDVQPDVFDIAWEAGLIGPRMCGDVLDAFALLQPDHRALLTEVYLNDREEQDIALEWGFSYTRIRSRLMQARQAFLDKHQFVVEARKCREAWGIA